MTDPSIRKFASASWSIEDVQSRFDIADNEAEDFLLMYGKYIQERMIKIGWEVIENIGKEIGLPEVKGE